MGKFKWLTMLFIFIFSIFFVGCNSSSSQETLAQLKSKIASYESENAELKKHLAELETDTEQEAAYQLNFREAENIDIPRSMYVEDITEIRVFPYENAEVINSVSNSYVEVHTKVINDEKEEWALVGFTDFVNTNNYGYVKIRELVDKPYEPKFKCDTESISGVAIGDTVEKAISQFGTDYTKFKKFGLSYSFKEGGIAIAVDPISNTVKRIVVRMEGYKTKESVQVVASMVVSTG